ncbi:MAG: type III polyketide synthase [Deltaproteobacteria bacterium]|nr:MAG: type III polyketide synthase [Deltaproteobacteria bacterium]
MQIAAVGRALPSNYHTQEELLEEFRRIWKPHFRNVARLEQIHRNVLVRGRHLALPVEEYEKLDSFARSNAAFIRCAVDLGAEAVIDGLERSGLSPQEIDHIFFVSITGVAAPSIDARLVNRLKLRPDIKRTPIFGLGCVAGAAGVARAADYLKAFPDHVAVLLSVELCSLTFQRRDRSIANVIASGLFGDGAAAVVMTGGAHEVSGPTVVATRSSFYPDTESVMGWDVTSEGFRIVLSGDVPQLARENIRKDVDAFLSEHGLSLADIRRFICHPGGPKVLCALEEALELSAGALQTTWKSLREVGNLSSASVLLVLRETLAEAPPPPGSHGLMISMGPGFCSELVLIRW